MKAMMGLGRGRTGWILWMLAVSVHAELYANLALRQGANSLGTIRIELDAARAPRPVANFVGLATGQRPWMDPVTGALETNKPFYNGTIFHRLIHDFVLQGGDRSGTGNGGPGYIFQDQFHPDLHHETFAVSMAHSGPNSNGSQFFLVLGNASHLDNYHSVFGVITDSVSRAIVQSFTNSAAFPTDSSNKPLTDIVIESVTIGGDEAATLQVLDPALMLPTLNGVVTDIVADESNPLSPVHALRLATQFLSVYPIGWTTQLSAWSAPVNFLHVMGSQTEIYLPIPEPAPGTNYFFRVARVDYSPAGYAPLAIFQNGAVLEMAMHGGILAVLFDGAGAGIWQYTDADKTVTSGNLLAAQAGKYTLAGMPVLPNGNAFLYGTDLGTYHLVRALYLEFDQPVGPLGVSETEGTLSFGAAASGGWYNDDDFNKWVEDPAYFLRGQFMWYAP